MRTNTESAVHARAIPAQRGKAKTQHQRLIDEILRDFPEAQTRGFMRTLSKLPDADYIQDMCENDRDWYRYVSFVPDAFLIDPELRHVVVFEAVVTHDISDEKFALMADMSWALDEDYYRLILVRCDRYGRVAYDVQTTSLTEMLDNLRKPESEVSWKVEDWPKYTLQYCAQRLELAA
jgi:hypothetical protein